MGNIWTENNTNKEKRSEQGENTTVKTDNNKFFVHPSQFSTLTYIKERKKQFYINIKNIYFLDISTCGTVSNVCQTNRFLLFSDRNRLNGNISVFSHLSVWCHCRFKLEKGKKWQNTCEDAHTPNTIKPWICLWRTHTHTPLANGSINTLSHHKLWAH